MYQFARDAAVAEQWLIAQEPYLLNEDLGETLDQVEQLIKKHETFEKSIHAQEDRFNALRKLTTLEQRNRKSLLDYASGGGDTLSRQPVERKNLEQSRLALYLEEFKTIEERDREMETQREQEKRIREAEERVKREQELENEKAARQRASDVKDVTKAMTAAGSATMPSTSRLTTSPQGKGNLNSLFCYTLISEFIVFCDDVSGEHIEFGRGPTQSTNSSGTITKKPRFPSSIISKRYMLC